MCYFPNLIQCLTTSCKQIQVLIKIWCFSTDSWVWVSCTDSIWAVSLCRLHIHKNVNTLFQIRFMRWLTACVSIVRAYHKSYLYVFYVVLLSALFYITVLSIISCTFMQSIYLINQSICIQLENHNSVSSFVV